MITFLLDSKSGVPFYRQIIDQIRFGIATGELRPGEQLPTVRSLAVELKVNLNTVSKAYKELEIQSVLETQQGTGTFVGDVKVEISSKERESKLKSLVNDFMSITQAYNFTVEEVIEELKRNKGRES